MSSSKNKSKSSTQTTSTPVSLQDVTGVTVAGNSGSAINITDGGAIAGMENLASLTVEKAAALTLGILDRQLTQSEKVFESTQAAQTRAYDFAMDAGRSDVATTQDMTKGLLIVGGIMAAGFAFKAFKG